MRNLWSIFSFLAVVHLLALLMFAGWLWSTERLNGERLQAVRELFALTVPKAEQAAEEARQQAAQAELAAEQQRRMSNPPVTSADQVVRLARIDEQVQVMLHRMEEESRLLARELNQRETQLRQWEEEFEKRRLAWEATTEAERQRRSDEQFQKTVRLLEALPPKQAKQKIQELVARGETSQAVAYLNEMNPRNAAAVLETFRTDEENRLATELLQKLRKFGLEAEPTEAADHADAVASAEP